MVTATATPRTCQPVTPPDPSGQPWVSTCYGYDSLSRLSSVDAPEGVTAYGYDASGNRLSMTRAGVPTTYSYDAADRLQQVAAPSGVIRYTVDNAGQVVARGPDAFAYDPAHRLTSATVGGTQTSFTYDGAGARASLTTGGSATTYVSDPTTALSLLLDDGQQKYVWGPEGLAYAEDRSGALTVYHTDGLGSIRALTNGAGQVVQTYRTDAFGGPLAAGTQGLLSQPFGFTGEQADPATAFRYLRARYYDPMAGRFLTQDPWPANLAAPQTLDRYVYVGNNPTTLVDPSGMHADQAKGFVVDFGRGFTAQGTVNESFGLAGPWLGPQPGESTGMTAGRVTADVGSTLQGTGEMGGAAGAMVAEGVGCAGTGALCLASPVVVAQAVPLAAHGVAQAGYGGYYLQRDFGILMASSAGSGGAAPGPAPDFVVTSDGVAVAVPDGATGPVPVTNPKGATTGFAYTGGSGGRGMNPRVADVRVMDPVPPQGSSPGYPDGYAVYQNGSKQAVDPITGKTVAPSDPAYHHSLTP